jgi:hypothetical protein
MNTETKNAGLAILETNPKHKEIYVTSDGNLFFNKDHAVDHAHKLKTEVETIFREKNEVSDENPDAPDNTEDVVGTAIEAGIITKPGGGYLKFGETTLGQGMEKAVIFLDENPEVRQEVINEVLKLKVE